MPSLTHEALLLLFRNRPELAPELLRDALGVALPAYTEVRIESADLTQVAPTEYHADLVVLLVEGKPVLGIVLEVQLAPHARKRFTWPLYAVGLRARLECDACVLVVTPSAEVARWASKPIALGPGGTLQPLVIGPDAVPVVADVERARHDPELAVLSALAHGDDEPQIAVQVGFAALVASLGLDDERALLYSDWIRVALGQAARAALEELMETRGYEFQSEFARKHHNRGVAEGEAKGKAEGEAKGKAEGKVEGKAEALLRLLEKRGLAVADSMRERVLSCTDIELLDRWFDRAVTASDTDAVFE